ncbi:MAG: hypothetical protein K6343_05410 [Caldisericaceae bacterium]
MAINPNLKKIEVEILTERFIIRGFIFVPANIRLSDALNKFLKETVFIAVTEAEIKIVNSEDIFIKKDFILVNKEKVVSIMPLAE